MPNSNELEEKRLKTRSTIEAGVSNESYVDELTARFFEYFKDDEPVEPSDISLSQDDLTEFTVKFLNFTSNFIELGKVCNKAICCHYEIEVEDVGPIEGKV